MGPYDGMNLIRKDPYDGLGRHEESPYDGTNLMNPITFSSNGNSVYSNSKGNHNNKDDKYENKVGNKSNNISKYSSKTNNKNNIKNISTHHMKPISTYNEYGARNMDHDNMNKEKWFHAQDMGKEVFQMTRGDDTNHAQKMDLRTDRVHWEGQSTGSQDQGVEPLF